MSRAAGKRWHWWAGWVGRWVAGGIALVSAGLWVLNLFAWIRVDLTSTVYIAARHGCAEIANYRRAGSEGWVWLADLPGYDFTSRFGFLSWWPEGGVFGGPADRYWDLEIPFWLMVLVFGGLACWAWWGRIGRRRREGACRGCGYSLAGLAAGTRCPECGHASPAHPQNPPASV